MAAIVKLPSGSRRAQVRRKGSRSATPFVDELTQTLVRLKPNGQSIKDLTPRQSSRVLSKRLAKSYIFIFKICRKLAKN